MKQALMGLILVLMLVAFAGIGIAHVFKPDYFMKCSGVRKSGEMLTEWNRLGFQIAGAIFAAVAIYMLYSVFRR
jgi:hypothetical protein